MRERKREREREQTRLLLQLRVSSGPPGCPCERHSEHRTCLGSPGTDVLQLGAVSECSDFEAALIEYYVQAPCVVPGAGAGVGAGGAGSGPKGQRRGQGAGAMRRASCRLSRP